MLRTSTGTSAEAGQLRGAPAAFAGDDLVALGARRAVDGADQDRLHDALGLDRGGQFGQRILIHVGARLVLAGLQAFDRQVAQFVFGLSLPESSASRPRPSPFILIMGDPFENFLGECAVGLRTLRVFVEGDDRLAVGRRFGQADVARHDGLVDLVAEMAFEFAGNLLGQRALAVVHGAQQAFDFEPRIEVVAHLAQGFDEVGQAFQRVVLALHRDQHGIGGDQGVDGQHVERRRAVDQDEVVVGVAGPGR
jgi:hypothetical protein